MSASSGLNVTEAVAGEVREPGKFLAQTQAEEEEAAAQWRGPASLLTLYHRLWISS